MDSEGRATATRLPLECLSTATLTATPTATGNLCVKEHCVKPKDSCYVMVTLSFFACAKLRKLPVAVEWQSVWQSRGFRVAVEWQSSGDVGPGPIAPEALSLCVEQNKCNSKQARRKAFSSAQTAIKKGARAKGGQSMYLNRHTAKLTFAFAALLKMTSFCLHQTTAPFLHVLDPRH